MRTTQTSLGFMKLFAATIVLGAAFLLLPLSQAQAEESSSSCPYLTANSVLDSAKNVVTTGQDIIEGVQGKLDTAQGWVDKYTNTVKPALETIQTALPSNAADKLGDFLKKADNVADQAGSAISKAGDVLGKASKALSMLSDAVDASRIVADGIDAGLALYHGDREGFKDSLRSFVERAAKIAISIAANAGGQAASVAISGALGSTGIGALLIPVVNYVVPLATGWLGDWLYDKLVAQLENPNSTIGKWFDGVANRMFDTWGNKGINAGAAIAGGCSSGAGSGSSGGSSSSTAQQSSSNSGSDLPSAGNSNSSGQQKSSGSSSSSGSASAPKKSTGNALKPSKVNLK